MDDASNMPPASILVIDDEVANLKLVGNLLSEQG
jgi:CheY-like chemotaxis protein